MSIFSLRTYSDQILILHNSGFIINCFQRQIAKEYFSVVFLRLFFFLDIRLRERALILANVNSMEMTAIREYVSIIKIKSIPLVVVLSYQIQYDWNVQYITALLYLLKVWRTKYLLNITENLPLLGKFWYYQNYTCEYSLVNNV